MNKVDGKPILSLFRSTRRAGGGKTVYSWRQYFFWPTQHIAQSTGLRHRYTPTRGVPRSTKTHPQARRIRGSPLVK